MKESAQNYLETILLLEKSNGVVRSIDVAKTLGVTKPSVSRAVGLLKEGGYITVEADGTVTEGNILQSTDRRFAKRVRSAVAAAPAWRAATKRGVAVASEHLLAVQLPKGKKLPREPYIIML